MKEKKKRKEKRSSNAYRFDRDFYRCNPRDFDASRLSESRVTRDPGCEKSSRFESLETTGGGVFTRETIEIQNSIEIPSLYYNYHYP